MATRIYKDPDPKCSANVTLRFPDSTAPRKSDKEKEPKGEAILFGDPASAVVRERPKGTGAENTNGQEKKVGSPVAGCPTDESAEPQQAFYSVTVVDGGDAKKAATNIPIPCIERKQKVRLVIKSRNMGTDKLIIEFSEELGFQMCNGIRVTPLDRIEVTPNGDLCYIDIEMVPTVMIYEANPARKDRLTPGITQPGLANSDHVQFVYAAADGTYHLLEHGKQEDWTIEHAQKWKTCHKEDDLIRAAWQLVGCDQIKLKKIVQDFIDEVNKPVNDNIDLETKNKDKLEKDIQAAKKFKGTLSKAEQKVYDTSVLGVFQISSKACDLKIAELSKQLFTGDFIEMITDIEALLERMKTSGKPPVVSIYDQYTAEFKVRTTGAVPKRKPLPIEGPRMVKLVGWYEEVDNQTTELVDVNAKGISPKDGRYSGLAFQFTPKNISFNLNTPRNYAKPYALGRFFGALAAHKYADIVLNGSVGKDGTGSPSVTHFNGNGIDIRYLRKAGTGVVRFDTFVVETHYDKKTKKKYSTRKYSDSPSMTGLDIELQNQFNKDLVSFGFTRLLSHEYRLIRFDKVMEDDRNKTLVQLEIARAEMFAKAEIDLEAAIAKLKAASCEISLPTPMVGMASYAHSMFEQQELKLEERDLKAEVVRLTAKIEDLETRTDVLKLCKHDSAHHDHLHVND